MNKKLEELLGKGNRTMGEIVYPKQYVLNLLRFVREKTIEECIANAEVDYVILDIDSVEAYLIRGSLSNLDKNSIEIYE